MLRAIQDFFRGRIDPGTAGGHDEHSLHLATAALLFEVQRADFEEHDDERKVLERVLQETFALSKEETRELARLAQCESEDSVSLHQFTHIINQRFSPEEKVRVVEMLWQVAFADGRIDRYEEALVRKISELIYVPHRAYIQARHRAQDAQ
ncbi:putative tellurite resistance protein B-like protein [Thiogranum longum]|uniref:Putative tellurite resistance protein B-like protein n=1 Tax=Thiogranum longum TaxID=1537524 RepID=A0A4R1H628_9GAMM|nr:TerB family tellurite resistance protein [Thiogranum longum]TCK17187.1 putative tellurite resistance protein B-like protein [Thiogranum longum]